MTDLKYITEDDLVHHVFSSIESWLGEDDLYWYASRVVEDSSFEFSVSDNDGNERTWTFTCREN